MTLEHRVSTPRHQEAKPKLPVTCPCSPGFLGVLSNFPFKKIAGVECTPYFNAIALKNITAYKSQSQKCFNIESICTEASVFPIPDEKTVFYLFNPFDDQILGQLLSNIEKSLVRRPSEIFLIYVNPRYRELMDDAKFLKLIKEEKGYDEYTSYSLYSSNGKANNRAIE